MHTMTMKEEHEGTETWTCPDCGYTLLIDWNPWRRVVVQRGDDHAIHSGSKGGLVMGKIEIGEQE